MYELPFVILADREQAYVSKSSERKTMYFEIVAASGGYRAHMKDGNHRLIWWTEVYVTKANAVHACRLAQAGAPHATIYDRT